MQQADVADFARSGSRDAPNQIAQVRAVGLVQHLHQLHLHIQADAFDFQQRSIDFIGTTTGSQTDDPARLHGMSPTPS